MTAAATVRWPASMSELEEKTALGATGAQSRHPRGAGAGLGCNSHFGRSSKLPPSIPPECNAAAAVSRRVLSGTSLGYTHTESGSDTGSVACSSIELGPKSHFRHPSTPPLPIPPGCDVAAAPRRRLRNITILWHRRAKFRVEATSATTSAAEHTRLSTQSLLRNFAPVPLTISCFRGVTAASSQPNEYGTTLSSSRARFRHHTTLTTRSADALAPTARSRAPATRPLDFASTRCHSCATRTISTSHNSGDCVRAISGPQLSFSRLKAGICCDSQCWGPGVFW